jgi:pSer/pThr/pTyr-binding forkhead associated (FHA) protein
MILPHESISRKHVAIRALGEEILLEDQSTYGTTVNGNIVSSISLSEGDVITMGPYLITVRRTRIDRSEESVLTKPFRVVSASSEAMGGRLEKVALSEVLQQIEFNQKTGTLRVFDDLNAANGILVVYLGNPVYAEFGEHRDADAVFKMLSLKAGTFSFVSKVEAGEKTIERTLTGLLLEAGRQIDESTSPEE